LQRDDSGLWSANVTVFGAWAPGIDYTLDWLMASPPELAPRRRMIEHDRPAGPWFTLIDLALPVAPHREVPLALHVAAVTGTWGSDTIRDHLFACADLVVFYAETVRYQLERTKFAREDLDRFLAGRGTDVPIVVFQLDQPWVGRAEYDDGQGNRIVEEPMVVLDVETLRRELAIGDRPYVETNARDRQVAAMYRLVVQQLLGARDHLVPRAAYAQI
jgi:hypothetical protein